MCDGRTPPCICAVQHVSEPLHGAGPNQLHRVRWSTVRRDLCGSEDGRQPRGAPGGVDELPARDRIELGDELEHGCLKIHISQGTRRRPGRCFRRSGSCVGGHKLHALARSSRLLMTMPGVPWHRQRTAIRTVYVERQMLNAPFLRSARLGCDITGCAVSGCI